MFRKLTGLVAVLVFTGWTHAASAALIQDLFFFDGSEEVGELIFDFRVTFPAEAGCVDFIDFELPSCADGQGADFPEFPADSVSATPLFLEGETAPLVFLGGFWEINDDWFLELFAGLFGIPDGESGEIFPILLVGGVGGEEVGLGPEFFPFPDGDDPFGSIGSYIALFGQGDVVAIPSHGIPVPATLLLMGLGLLGLGWSRRKA